MHIVTRMVVTIAVLSVPGCADDGAEEPPPPSATASDTALPADGVDGGADLDGASAPRADEWSGPTARTAACFEYMKGFCERETECGLESGLDYAADVAHCLWRNANLCPDAVFAKGSTRTVEGTRACADEWRTLSCADLRNRRAPTCAQPGKGKRVAGATCVTSFQCESRRCSAYGTSCGTCAPFARTGEDCTTGAACLPSDRCDLDTGVCTFYETPGVPRPELQLGDECVRSENSCGAHDCREVDGGVSRCIPYPGLGEYCNVTRRCAPGEVYCELDGLTCRALPKAGLPCGVDGSLGVPGHCAPGSACDVEASPPVCRALPVAGERCEAACAGDASCECDSKGCDARHCMRHRMPGESCSGDFDICLAGASRCEDGICKLVQWQNLFEDLCGR